MDKEVANYKDATSIIVENWGVVSSLYTGGSGHVYVHSELQKMDNPVGKIPFNTYKTKYCAIVQVMTLAKQWQLSSDNTIRELTTKLDNITAELHTANKLINELSMQLETANAALEVLETTNTQPSLNTHNPSLITDNKLSNTNTTEENTMLSQPECILTKPVLEVIQQMINESISKNIASIANNIANNIITANNLNSDNNDVVSRANANKLANNSDAISEVKTKHKVPLPVSVPSSFDGWNVRLSNGYYQLFKRFNRKQVALHIGKRWDAERAKVKIAEYVAKESVCTKEPQI